MQSTAVCLGLVCIEGELACMHKEREGAAGATVHPSFIFPHNSHCNGNRCLRGKGGTAPGALNHQGP